MGLGHSIRGGRDHASVGTAQVGAGDHGVRVCDLEHSNQGERSDEGPEHKRLAPASQHRDRKPEHDDREPDQEGGREEPQLRESVGFQVIPHALEGRGHDRQEEKELKPTEDREDRASSWVFMAQKPIRGENPWERKCGRYDKLEETLPRVLRVRQPGRDLHKLRSSEEISELDDHETHEQHIDQAKCSSHFPNSKGGSRDDRRSDLAQPRACQESTQIAAGQPSEHADRDQMGHQELEVDRHDVAHDAGEDRVGGQEESPEDQQRRSS